MEDNRQNQKQQPEFDDEINLLELLQVLIKRRMMIMKVTVVAAVLAVIYSLTLTNIYTASAKLLPPQKDGGGGAAALLGQLGGLGGMMAGLGGSADLYMGILQSRSVADAVIKRLDLATELEEDNPDILRNRLRGIVTFSSGKTDGIITVSADHKEPEKAALFANTFVDELQKRSLELNLSKASTERDFLEKRLELVKQDLKKSEDELKEFQIKNKTIKADSQAAASIEAVARMKAEIVTKEVQLAALRHSMTDEAPEVKSLLAGISGLRRQMASMSGAGDANGVIPGVGSAPGIGVEYVRLLREFKLQEAMFEQITKQYELAKLNEARDSSSLQVLDEAVVPELKSKPKRSLIVIVATLAAFMLAIFAAFVQEFLSKLPPEDAVIVNEIKQDLQGSYDKLRAWLPKGKKQQG